MIELKCKNCSRKIEENSLFCNWCGSPQLKTKKKSAETKVPKPVQRGGKWWIYLRKEGQSVTADTEADCIKQARAIRDGFVKAEKNNRCTLKHACELYISRRPNVLSPSTVRGYDSIMRTRFKEYMSKDIRGIDYQKMIDDEYKLVSGKTIKNAWGFVSSALVEQGVPRPNVTMPQVKKKDLPWLDTDQIKTLLADLHGRSCEMPALLALHSLRASEFYAVTPSKIKDGKIIVSGAMVRTKDSGTARQYKPENKTSESEREVPIIIPRLQELVDDWTGEPDAPFVTARDVTIYKSINAACRRCGLPEVGIHGLRRSFASLCYRVVPERVCMKYGGWSDYKTMHNIYIKLSEKDLANDTEKLKEIFAPPAQ